MYRRKLASHNVKKLQLSRETLRVLNHDLADVRGGLAGTTLSGIWSDIKKLFTVGGPVESEKQCHG